MPTPVRLIQPAMTALALVLAVDAPATAQTSNDSAVAGIAPAAPETPASDPQGLEEIVVTAQKRSESLQRTPLAISAVNAATIEARGITTAEDLGSIAPNLTTTQGPNSSAHLIIFIRGIGESEPILTADTPVGVYVDGVIIGRSTGGIFDLVDLERVEVLRGPQGTLYGRNTTGGAVNLITKKPADTFGLTAMGGAGNLGAFQGRLSVDTGELGGSGIRAKFSYLHKQRQGYLDDLNAPDSKDPGAYNNDAFRLAVAFDNGGPFRASYTYDHTDSTAYSPATQLTAATANIVTYFTRSAAVGGTAFIPPSPDRYDTLRLDLTKITDKNRAHTATIELDIAQDTVLRSISGYRRWHNDTLATDLDGNAGLRGLVVSPAPPGIKPIALFGADKFDDQNQFSQELNLLGKLGERVDYVLGGYYFREKSREINPQFYTFVTTIPGLGLAGVNLTNNLTYRHRNESKAAFGQATYRFTDALSFTGGLRYTEDEKELNQTSPIARDITRKFNKLNYAATLQYQATPDLMAYARVASGYKAGGFNARSVNQGYDPETVTSYEAGMKTEFLDRRLRVNGTLFYTDLKGKQLNQLTAGTNGASSVTVNAGSAEFTGVELEVEALPVDGLRLNGSVGYTDRNFKTFNILDPATNTIVDIADEAQFSYSASTTYNLGGEYTFGAVAGGSLSARLDYSYRSRLYFNVVPRFAQFDRAISSPGIGLLDGRVSLADLPFGTTTGTVAVWARNLTNEKYRVSGIDFGALGFATNTYSEPRTFGVDFKVKF